MECLVTRFMVMILREFGVNSLRIKVRNVEILEMDGRWSRYGVRTGKFMNMVVVHGGFMVVAWWCRGVFGSLGLKTLATLSSSPN
ncbi:hypothetical protein Tco_0694988 [Tanacetum coccineum]